MFDSDRAMDPRIRRAQQQALRANEREIIARRADVFVKKNADKLLAEGIPLTTSGDARIDMEAFSRGVYAQDVINRDKEYIIKMNQRWQDQQARLGHRTENEDDKKLRQGERLEILKTALFQKYLGQDFIVIRSSEYDDVVGGVDNVIVDRRSGNLVCAFDEVGEESGALFDNKKTRVTVRNKFGGAKLRYGFSVGSDKKITLGPIDNIPIFYLAMSPEKIEAALRSFDEQAKSEQDRAAFRSFLDLILNQIDQLSKPEVGANAIVKEKSIKMGSVLRQYQE